MRVLVAVPNRPGAISEIATALGHAHINIEDLSLRPGPPDGEGELVLVVGGPEAAREAVRLVGRARLPGPRVGGAIGGPGGVVHSAPGADDRGDPVVRPGPRCASEPSSP